MPDAPSNLPFEDAGVVPTSPPQPPVLPPLAPPVPPQAPPAVPPVPPPSVPRPTTAPPQDVFEGIETAPMPVVKEPVVPPPLPPEPSAGHGKTVALIALLIFLLVGGAGGAWYGYQAWDARRAPALVPQTNRLTPTSSLPILPPPAQVPSSDLDQAVPLPGDTPSVQVTPLPTPVTTPPANVPPPTPVDPSAPFIPTAPVGGGSAGSFGGAVTSTAPVATSVEFDTDGDGLTDTRERELGTDPLKADTDLDTLNDGQEVLAYGTNPLNADTDADGFPDGVEIQNGFNPRGTGRCSKPDCRL